MGMLRCRRGPLGAAPAVVFRAIYKSGRDARLLVLMRPNPRFPERMRTEEGCISREENKRRCRSEDPKRNICCSCCKRLRWIKWKA